MTLFSAPPTNDRALQLLLRCLIIGSLCSVACAASPRSAPGASSDGGGDLASEAGDDGPSSSGTQDGWSASTDGMNERGSSSGSGADGGGGARESGAEGGAAEGGELDCSALPLCDGFESVVPGMPPSTSLWHVLMGCDPNTQNGLAPIGGLTVGVDSSTRHTGKNSLRVVGGDACGYYAVNTGAFSKLGQQVYSRFYAHFSGTGNSVDGGAATMGHNGFLSLYSGTTSGVDPNFYKNYNTAGPTSGQLRLGFQNGVMDWNNLINGMDSTLPDMDPMGTALSVSPGADTWDCYEFHIDETSNHIEFWFNGASVPGLSWDGGNVQGVNDQWHNQGPPPLQLQSFGLGWLHLNDQETAWYDDVALSGSRIGCL